MARAMSWMVAVASVCGLALPGQGAPPQLISATYLGTAGSDDLQDVAIGDDGTIYVVGNIDQPLADLPKGVKSATIGQPVEGTWYRCGLLATFNADASKMLSCLQFARGQVFLTSVALGREGVYVGGYGVEKLNDLLGPLGGVNADCREANKAPVPDPQPGGPPDVIAKQPEGIGVVDIKTRHHGDKGGVPFVARLNRDLTALAAGTFLEGHHYAWNVAMPLYEEEWTPTEIALLPGGDVAVCHDGGVPGRYYYAADYISRLSPDLKKRAWKVDIYHPEIKPIDKIWAKDKKYEGWKIPILGQVRILRMRADAKGNVYAGGWSVSMTSREPWWCPFLWKLDQDGKIVWKAYTCDPMGGRENRVNGLVSDSAIRSAAVDDDGNLLVSGISDGGNTVLRQDPLDYNKPAPRMKGGFGGMKGRVEYVGHMMRLDANTGELLAGTGFGSYGKNGYQATWAVDLTPLPGKRALAVGRHNQNYPSSPEAWFTPTAERGMFLKVLTDNCTEQFSVNVPYAIPYAVARKGARCVVVGIAETDQTPVRKALFPKHAGGLDAYLLVGDFPE